MDLIRARLCFRDTQHISSQSVSRQVWKAVVFSRFALTGHLSRPAPVLNWPQSRTGPSPELARVQNGIHNVAPRRARGTPSKGPLGLEQGKLVSLLRFLQPSGRHPALV